MSIAKVSKSVLTGYDLRKVESSLGECEEGVGICVGGLQIGGQGEGEATARVEGPKQRPASDSFAPFSRDTSHVQILPDREASSDDDEESGDDGDEGNFCGPPVSETPTRTSGGAGDRYPFECPRDGPREVSSMQERKSGYEDLYLSSSQRPREIPNTSQSNPDLHRAKRDEILRLFDNLTLEGTKTHSEGASLGNVGLNQAGPTIEGEAEGGDGQGSTSDSTGGPKSLPTDHGGCQIPFSVDQHLTAPIWVRHDQLISLIEQLASAGGFTVSFEKDQLILKRQGSQSTLCTAIDERSPPTKFLITWGDFKKKLAEGFVFPLRGSTGTAVINSSSYGLGMIEEQQVEIDPADTEKDVLIACLKIKGLYDYLSRKLNFD